MMTVDLGRTFLPGTLTLEAYIRCVHCERIISCQADVADESRMDAPFSRDVAETKFTEWGWRQVALSKSTAWLCPTCVAEIERGKDKAWPG